jgi:hypothetical protein
MHLIVNLIDKNSSRTVTQTIVLENKTLEEIKSEFDTMVSESGFTKYYTDNEVDGELSNEVQSILEQLDLIPD